MKTKYAIVIGDREKEGEFYPDPTYDTKEKALEKIKYLDNYRITHDMVGASYKVEKLSKERLAQHTGEWTRWVASID